MEEPYQVIFNLLEEKANLASNLLYANGTLASGAWELVRK